MNLSESVLVSDALDEPEAQDRFGSSRKERCRLSVRNRNNSAREDSGCADVLVLAHLFPDSAGETSYLVRRAVGIVGRMEKRFIHHAPSGRRAEILNGPRCVNLNGDEGLSETGILLYELFRSTRRIAHFKTWWPEHLELADWTDPRPFGRAHLVQLAAHDQQLPASNDGIDGSAQGGNSGEDHSQLCDWTRRLPTPLEGFLLLLGVLTLGVGMVSGVCHAIYPDSFLSLRWTLSISVP